MLPFIHYKLDAKKVKKIHSKYQETKELALSEHDKNLADISLEELNSMSCLFSTFDGETELFGLQELIQDVTNYMKEGIDSAGQVFNQIFGVGLSLDFTKIFYDLKKIQKIKIYDLVQEPMIVRL